MKQQQTSTEMFVYLSVDLLPGGNFYQITLSGDNKQGINTALLVKWVEINILKQV